jgi:hypothetical protein
MSKGTKSRQQTVAKGKLMNPALVKMQMQSLRQFMKRLEDKADRLPPGILDRELANWPPR